MPIKYSPKYTPCGRSIRKLKAEARTLKKLNSGLSQRRALDLTAKGYLYSCWDEMVSLACQQRDVFVDEYYRSKDEVHHRTKYQNFLNLKRLNDTADSYRMFAVESYAQKCKAEYHDEACAETDIIPDKIVIVQLLKHKDQLGAEGFLPQNLTDTLLRELVGRFQKGVTVGFQDTEIRCSDEPNILVVMALLKEHQPRDFGTRKMLEGDFLSRYAEIYYEALRLETASRLTSVSFSPLPSLESILDKQRKFSCIIEGNYEPLKLGACELVV